MLYNDNPNDERTLGNLWWVKLNSLAGYRPGPAKRVLSMPTSAWGEFLKKLGCRTCLGVWPFPRKTAGAVVGLAVP